VGAQIFDPISKITHFLTSGKVWWQSAARPPRLRIEKQKKEKSTAKQNWQSVIIVMAAVKKVANNSVMAKKNRRAFRFT